MMAITSGYNILGYIRRNRTKEERIIPDHNIDLYNDQTMGDYFTKYTFNPFHQNANFYLSIHRMSENKAGLIQVTVRSNSRIASYYVERKTTVTD